MEACFPCLGARKRRVPPPPAEATSGDPRHRSVAAAARTFSFEELAAATRRFRDDRLVAGREPFLYKGHLKSVNQVVTMKLQHLVDRNGSTGQRNSEFLARVLMLNALRHPNIVSLIGFWMNIAAGVARGLEYLHDRGVAYRCLRSSDILLGVGDGYRYPKLSQYGLAKVGQFREDPGEARDFARRAFGTLGPEAAMSTKLSVASDVYSFGVVLLEMITWRRAYSPRAAVEDRILVAWARPLLEDRAGFRRMADPALQGRYPSMDLEEALAVASMCIQEDPAMRSPIGAVVTALAILGEKRSRVMIKLIFTCLP